MADQEIARYERANENFLRAMLGEFKGKTMFSFRNWYTEEGELRPSKNGLNLSTEEYPEFRELVQRMDEELTFNALEYLPEVMIAGLKALAMHCLEDPNQEIRQTAADIHAMLEEA